MLFCGTGSLGGKDETTGLSADKALGAAGPPSSTLTKEILAADYSALSAFA